MKYIQLYALLLMSVFTACNRQVKKDLTKENIRSRTKDIATTHRADESNIYKIYEYVDSAGKSVIIQNSFPRGVPRGDGYKDSNGKKEFGVLLWTQITNETENPVELNLNFPVEYEIAFFPGKYIKLLLPPDTMTLDKDPLQDYGLKEITSFIDNNLHKPSSLKRAINPKESSGFYFLLIFDKGVSGTTRTGLSIKGQNLFYEISRCDCTREHSIWDKKEINCGIINLKNLMLKK